MKMRHWTGFDRDAIIAMLRSHVENEAKLAETVADDGTCG